MATTRLLQNSFVAGLLSREMDGRSDLEQYQKGAADIVNFIPRRTGGLRKRAGTQFVARVAADEAPRAWRVFSYTFDRDECGAVVLWLAASGALMSRFMRLDGGVGAPAEAAAVADGWTADDLENCKCLQAGDTLFVTRAGRRTLRCKVEFSSIDALSWSKMPEHVAVADAPALSAAPSGFATASSSYASNAQRYCLVAVKDGVMSAMRTADANITLPWVQNAVVTVSFTPSWAQADFYLIGKKTGASYVLIGTVYPETESSAPAPAARAALSSITTSGTWADSQYHRVDGYNSSGTQTYWAASVTSIEFVAAIPAQWSPAAFNPNQLTAAGRHSHGIFFRNGVAVNFTVSGKIRRIEYYRGFVLNEVSRETTGYPLFWVRANVNHTLHLEVNVSGAWQSIGTQTFSGDFTTGATVWNIAEYSQTQTQYRIRWVCSNTSAPLPTRGFAVFAQASGAGAFSLVDNNLTATAAILPQDKLTVGDAGMDADIAAVFEQRMVFASSWQRPFSAWFSAVGNLNAFCAGRPQAAGDAFQISIPATTASRILHAFAGRALVLFTESGEYVASGEGGFGFQSARVARVSTVGIHPAVAPCESGGTLVFAGADGRSLFNMRYDLASDGMIGVDLSVFARDVFAARKIKRLAYQQFPDSVVWCLLDDGSLASMTFMPEQDVLAWARHEFGELGIGNGEWKLVDILSPQSVVEVEGCETSSVVFLVWQREGEPEALYIERMRAQVASDTVDAATAECADHVGYEGQGIGNGEWGMEAKRNVVAELRTLRPEHPQFQSMGAVKNILGVTVRLRRSGRVKIRPAEGWGADGTEPRELEWAEEGLGNGEWGIGNGDAIRLFSGDVKILPRSLQNAEGAFILRSDDGLPCEAQCVVFRLQYDGG